jgi:hypothetical protein
MADEQRIAKQMDMMKAVLIALSWETDRLAIVYHKLSRQVTGMFAGLMA